MSNPQIRKRTVLNFIGIVFCLAAIVATLIATGDSAISTRNILSNKTLEKTAEIKAIPVTLQSKPEQAVLTFNSQGKDIIDLQTQLKKRGYYLGALDGIYGEGTQEAVYNFQLSMGLETTGTVDPQTREFLQLNNSTSSNDPIPVMGLTTAAVGLSPDLQTIVDRGELIVAVLGIDVAPFFAKNQQGDLIGLDIKIAQDLATALGVSLKFNRTAKTFNDVVDIVDLREADLAISKLSQTLARAKKVLFSSPYLTLRHGLLINRLQLAKASKGKDTVDFLKNFEGKIGVIKGSSYVGFTQEKFPQAQIVEFTTWEDVISAAMRGDVLAAYRDELEVKKIIFNQPNVALNFKTVALTDTQDPISIAFPWSSRHLFEFVNLYLGLNKVNYTVDSLIEEYSDTFGKPQKTKHQ
ncbi:putative transporter [Planktothrix serta PCC 8927]|uniref:Transporter n=1 Tax=Planktothrix serta PCC 8927 TaxID=671068 RepID=A0A7Z9BQ55_9CYAN|nr:transporter substrate-binding domain-containing protein [Planktothrix serta]VXD16031.1 putative transporter [Planktothrix serta PCC 8927]